MTSPNLNTNASVDNFFNKVEKLLDEMAPVKKMTQKEVGLQQRPWINRTILAGMLERDKLHKDFLKKQILFCASRSTGFTKRKEIMSLPN